jgi:class 3 adenylate cyclase
MRGDLPSGTVTFLFTDVEGSTRLLPSQGQSAAPSFSASITACVADVARALLTAPNEVGTGPDS